MALSLVLASSVLACALGEATLYETSIAASARTRAYSGLLVAEEALEPRLGVRFLDRTVDLAVAYFPRLALQQQVREPAVVTENQVTGLQVLNRALATGTWRIDERWSLSSAAQGEYGWNDYRLALSTTGTAPQPGPPIPPGQPTAPTGPPPPPGQPPQTVQPVPTVTTVRYLSSEVVTSLARAPSGRTQLGFTLAGFVNGGADPPSRNLLPLQRGARASGELAWTASARDVLASNVAALYDAFGPDIVDTYVMVTETLRRLVAPGTHVKVGAGPALATHRVRGEGTTVRVLPAGGVGVSRYGVGALDGEVGVRAGPFIDRQTGEVYDRADLVLSLVVRPRPHLAILASGVTGVALGGTSAGDTITSADARVAWSPDETWEIATGARGWSQLPRTAIATGSELVVFVEITARRKGRL